MSDPAAIVRSCREEIAAVADILKEDVSAGKSRANNAIAAARLSLEGDFRGHRVSTKRGRPPLKKRAMTDTERKRRYRQSKSVRAQRYPIFTLRHDDPLAAPLITLWCALKSQDRDRAESICVRLSAAIDETKDVDQRAVDDALAIAVQMVRARGTP